MLTELRQVLESGSARRVSARKDVWLLNTGPWWHLLRDFRRLHATKSALLAAAWRLPCPLFLLPEEPLNPDLAPFVSPEGTAWRIDRNKTAAAFYETEPASGLGNWQLYAADKVLTARLPDAFRSAPDEVLAFMGSHGIVALIDVFHDDTEWCVALREPGPVV